MKNIRRAFTVLLTLLLSLVFVPVAWAHPLGNFTINHYAGLHVTPNSIDIDFVLDMAEIPAFQEIASFDANGNGKADVSEANAFHAAKCASLKSDLKLLLNNTALDLTLGSSSVEFPAGAGGLPTLRLTCEFSSLVPNTQMIKSISFADDSYKERIGWREIIVSADGVKLSGDFSSTSVSKRLTSYPQDLLSSPLDQRQITLGVGSLSVAPENKSVSSLPSIPSLAGSRSDRFTELITLQNLTLPTVLFALLISFLWGAMHALTPGHGKTIVGAYLVGSRGTMKHALYLGLTTTITHTLGVFAFGLITLFAARYIVPEKLFPWITVLSGLFVVGIGINLFIQRFRSSGISTWLQKLKPNQSPLQPMYAPSFNGLNIETAEHHHKFVLASNHGQPHVHGHAHDHHHGHDHNHDHSDHEHTPPETITWRNLLALGISGGLLPCPSALVVLLGAIALNKIGFGLILVLAFSLGLAGALTAIGMLFIYAGKLFQRFPSSGKVIGFLPMLSALFVSAIGAAILFKALMEIGVI
jgi:ABC-type nickel/cobalt efflux system permease component RcnA